MIFQTFVCMQLFNEINARKLGPKDFNVFGGFFNNPLFLLILVFTGAVQYFMVQLGGKAVRTIPLSTDMHLLCLGIGAFSLIWGVFVKFIPMSLFEKVKVDDTPMKAGQKSLVKSLKSMGRKKTSLSPTKSPTKRGLSPTDSNVSPTGNFARQK
jgi:hypothetical protein